MEVLIEYDEVNHLVSLQHGDTVVPLKVGNPKRLIKYLNSLKNSQLVEFVNNIQHKGTPKEFTDNIKSMYVDNYNGKSIVCLNESVYFYNKPISDKVMSIVNTMVDRGAYASTLHSLNECMEIEADSSHYLNEGEKLVTLVAMSSLLNKNTKKCFPALLALKEETLYNGDIAIVSDGRRCYRTSKSVLTEDVHFGDTRTAILEDWRFNLDSSLKGLLQTQIVEADFSNKQFVLQTPAKELYRIKLNEDVNQEELDRVEVMLDHSVPYASNMLAKLIEGVDMDTEKIGFNSLEEFDSFSVAGGPYLITGYDINSDNTVTLQLKNEAGKIYNQPVVISDSTLSDFGIEEYMSDYDQFIEKVNNDSRFDSAQELSQQILDSIAQDATKYLKRSSTGKSDSSHIGMVKKQRGLVVIGCDVNPLEIGKGDTAPVYTKIEPYAMILDVVDREGQVYSLRYNIRPDVVEDSGGIEEYVKNYQDEVDKVADIAQQGNWDEALKQSEELFKLWNEDGKSDRRRSADDKVDWFNEDGMQTGDIAEKIDFDITKPNVIDPLPKYNKMLESFYERGFEPDEQGYLHRGQYYLIREGSKAKLVNYNNIWDSDGNVLKECDLISIHDAPQENLQEEDITEVNSLNIIYRSNMTYNTYYNFKRPHSIEEIKKIRRDLINKEYYISEVAEHAEADKIDNKSQLIPPTYNMRISEKDEE